MQVTASICDAGAVCAFVLLALWVWWKETRQGYCYFQVYNPEQQRHAGPFQLARTGVRTVRNATYFFSPWLSVPTTVPNTPYYSLNIRPPSVIPFIYHGSRPVNITLPVGEYRIEFDTENGSLLQYLRIDVVNGILGQVIRVTQTAGDIVLYDSEWSRWKQWWKQWL